MGPAKFTSNGQVTIPVDVRAKLGLRAGSRLVFVATGDGGYEIHAEGGSVRDLKGSVPKPTTPVSLDEMNAAIASAAVDSSR